MLTIIVAAIAIHAQIALSAEFSALNPQAEIYPTSSPTMPFRFRRSAARGFADHGWLQSYHTFSFASYYDPEFEKYSSLRVINEDRVAGGQGFGAHGHRDFEIFSYVLEGRLEHKDSMGNKEVLERGQVQFTSAGSGITHSEYNADPKEPVRFLQMWVKPNATGLKPRYETKAFTDDEKRGTLKLLLSRDGREDSIRINQDADVFASLLDDGASVSHAFAEVPAGGRRKGYIHVPIMAGTKGLLVEGAKTGSVAELAPGDGLFIDGESEVKITGRATGEGTKAAEFVMFDLA